MGKKNEELKPAAAEGANGLDNENSSNQDSKQAPATVTEDRQDENGVKKFECWKVKPLFEDVPDPVTGEPTPRRKGTWKKADDGVTNLFFGEYEKVGDKPLSTTNIEQRHADTLNSQSDNSLQRYYLVD